MPERPRRGSSRHPGQRPSRRLGLGWLALGSILALAFATPVAALAGADSITLREAVGQAAPRPGETCPDATPAPGSSDFCDDTAPTNGDVGGGGLDLGALLPILAAAVIGALLALVAAFVVLGRRSTGPLAPIDPGEWWTCRSCGKTNVVGSPRCYACGTWQA
jgi:hypothetical protein